MATSVNLPALGESVTEGTVTRWLKQPGDTVAVDEPLLEVSTDKVDTEIPSPVAGTLLEIKAEEDETVEVGAELCIVGDEGEGGGSDSDDADEEEAGDSSDEAGEDSADEESGEPAEDDEAEAGSDEDEEPEDDEEPEEKPAAKKSSGGG